MPSALPSKLSLNSRTGEKLSDAEALADVVAALKEPLEFYAEMDRAYIARRVETCIRWQADKS